MSEKEELKTEQVAETAESSEKTKNTEAKVDRDSIVKIGDTVRVFYKIIEGKNERIQPYEGVVISRKGKGVSKTFTVRRLGADQVGIERIFPLNSPRITDIKVIRAGKIRRSKLYYLRTRTGRKESKIKEKLAKVS